VELTRRIWKMQAAKIFKGNNTSGIVVRTRVKAGGWGTGE
jgi:hypothetical protein